MVLSSDDGKLFYSDNKPFDFRIKLNRPIQLEGYWVLAITEFSTTERGAKEEMFVYSDVCQDSFIGDSEQPLIRRISFNDKNSHIIIYENPYYVPVKLDTIQQIHIYIKDSTGQEASFLKKKVTVTLHFKKFPFIM